MNTKFTLASIVVTLFLIATACSPEMSSLPIVDEAPPTEANYEIAPLVPLTGIDAGENTYAYEQDALAYPSQKFHSNCVSHNSHRQSMCEEREPNTIIRRSDDTQAQIQEYPSHKLHSHCVSEDVHRQNKCIDRG